MLELCLSKKIDKHKQNKGFVILEKRVYFLKFNKKILTIDLLSVISGIIGITLGVLSILALEPF